jgi:hypothetical protein
MGYSTNSILMDSCVTSGLHLSVNRDIEPERNILVLSPTELSASNDRNRR